MSWTGVITDVGKQLLAQWDAGGVTLTIDGATVGSGYVPAEDVRAATALSHEMADASIIDVDTSSTVTTRFKIQVGPSETTAYVAHEIGIWGHIGNGTKKLIALHQDTAEGVAIPTEAESPDFAFALFALHGISNSADIDVTIDPSAYVTQSTLDDAIDGIQDGIDAPITQAEINALFT